MFRTVTMRVVLFAAVLLLTACGDDVPTLSLLADSDGFQQNAGARSTKVDVLWVVDNSGSMQTSQENIGNNFSSFIQDFQNLNYDFQIGVITTDAYKALYGADSSVSELRDGVGANHSGEFILNKLTENLEQTFLTNILQGIAGSGNERAFQSLETALNNPDNSKFIREDAYLAVIVVSDEDDFSRDAAGWNENLDDPLMIPTIHYKEYLDTIKPPVADTSRYSVSAMAVWDQDCADSLTWAKIAVRYGELVDATGGTKGSLCGNFANELGFIADNILELATQFFLSRKPIVSTIKVIVDGVTVPSEGWTYKSESNSIVFHGSYTPAEGANIDVQYDPESFDVI